MKKENGVPISTIISPRPRDEVPISTVITTWERRRPRPAAPIAPEGWSTMALILSGLAGYLMGRRR